MDRRPAECHPDKPYWARGMCGTCYQRWWNEQNPGSRAARIKANQRPAECHPDKPELARGLCGTCYRRWWRRNNPGAEWERSAEANKRRRAKETPSDRRGQVLRRYGLTVETFDRMVADQDGVCAGCGTASEKPLQVDHCHASGRIRALLCFNCNSALGHAKDDPERLERLVAYLKRPEWAQPEPSLNPALEVGPK